MEEKIHNLPLAFKERMIAKLGDEYGEFIEALQEKPPISVRINPGKNNPQIEGEPIPWCEYGYYLKTRPAFVWDPLYHAGAYYAQEASSMLLSQTIDFSRPLKVLDLCAAPGGKSSLILSYLKPGSILVSNEMVGKRVNVLYENLVKWGDIKSFVTCNKPSDFLPFKNYFDVVVIDAPCSGEGMFRKDSEAVDQWTPGLVEQCSHIQKDILKVAIELISDKGLLVYSTCTFEQKENEENIKWFLDNFEGQIKNNRGLKQLFPGLTEIDLPIDKDFTQSTYYCFPHKVKGEGFFFTAISITKKSNAASNLKRIKVEEVTAKELSILHQYADYDEKSIQPVKWKDEIYLINKNSKSDFETLAVSVYLRKAGIRAGKIIRDTFVPDHELAMSEYFSKRISRVELDLKESLEYLQKNPVMVPENTPLGWILMTYKGENIGWAKNLGKRINNHYPVEWKIRKKPDF